MCGGADGDVWCWGVNIDGNLGLPDHLEVDPPQALPNLPKLADVSIQQFSGCGIAEDGAVWCWGDNSRGNLGRGTTDAGFHLPEPVPSVPPATRVEGFLESTCALTTVGEVYCWGANIGHVLTLHSGVEGGFVPTPIKLDVSDVIQIDVGFDYIVALKSDGTAWTRGNAAHLGRDTSVVPADQFGQVLFP